jgi:diaminopimelate decarboxylase
MTSFHYQNGDMFAEGVAVSTIVEAEGSPCYIYSRAAMEQAWQAYDRAFGEYAHKVCYAVKANSNLAVLDVLARLGSGFDIVSGGELARVLAAGGKADGIVFSGVGKTAEEMQQALAAGIACFNVESVAELELLNRVAGEQGVTAAIALRVNPDVDAKTHPYISTGLQQNKFGIDINIAPEVYAQAQVMEHIAVQGVACHIGSQLTELAPLLQAMERVLALAARLADDGIALQHLDLGGGLGVRYRDEQPPAAEDYVQALIGKLQQVDPRFRSLAIHIEPGRSIVANAGILVTRVLYTKETPVKNFVIVDAAMNDLMRPTLYDAWQEILPLRQGKAATQLVDVVGPICETGDFLARERMLAAQQHDLLAIMSAGAYGAVMSSNYNSRPRLPEIMVDGDCYHVVRIRESINELYASEKTLP